MIFNKYFYFQPEELAQLQQLIQSNPAIVPIIVNQIAQSNPQLLQAFGGNREALAQLLQNPQA